MLLLILLIAGAHAAGPTPIQADKPDNAMAAEIRKAYEQGEAKRLHRWPERRLLLKYDAQAFISQIGMPCLTTPDSSLAPQGHSLTIIDEPRCAKELGAVARKWNPRVTVTAIHGPIGARPAPGTEVYAPTPHCACVIQKGPRAE
jgi:hypothetical protein